MHLGHPCPSSPGCPGETRGHLKPPLQAELCFSSRGWIKHTSRFLHQAFIPMALPLYTAVCRLGAAPTSLKSRFFFRRTYSCRDQKAPSHLTESSCGQSWALGTSQASASHGCLHPSCQSCGFPHSKSHLGRLERALRLGVHGSRAAAAARQVRRHNHEQAGEAGSGRVWRCMPTYHSGTRLGMRNG